MKQAICRTDIGNLLNKDTIVHSLNSYTSNEVVRHDQDEARFRSSTVNLYQQTMMMRDKDTHTRQAMNDTGQNNNTMAQTAKQTTQNWERSTVPLNGPGNDLGEGGDKDKNPYHRNKGNDSIAMEDIQVVQEDRAPAPTRNQGSHPPGKEGQRYGNGYVDKGRQRYSVQDFTQMSTKLQ